MNNNYVSKLHKYICLELKTQRNRLELSQEEVAYQLKVSPSHFSRIENAKYSRISLFRILQICEYYKIDFEIIIKKAKSNMLLDNELKKDT